MKKTITLIALSIVMSLAGSTANAQGRPAADTQREAMEALGFLLGEWEGNGWIAFGPQRNEFRQTETVVGHLDGLLIVVEGKGRASEDNRVVHDAYAVVSYDDKTKRYRFAAYTGEGRYVDATATVGNDELEWGFESAYGTVRYTIRLTESGEWHEVGESSQNGTDWRQFFEMRLARVEP